MTIWFALWLILLLTHSLGVPSQHFDRVEVWPTEQLDSFYFQSFCRFLCLTVTGNVLLLDPLSAKLHLLEMAFSKTQRSSWSTQWLQGAQVMWLQNKPASSPVPHSDSEMMMMVCDMLCFIFSKCGAGHYSQRSPLWSHRSKGLLQTFGGFCRWDFANQSYTAVFFIKESSFLLTGNLSRQTVLVQHFKIFVFLFKTKNYIHWTKCPNLSWHPGYREVKH